MQSYPLLYAPDRTRIAKQSEESAKGHYNFQRRCITIPTITPIIHAGVIVSTMVRFVELTIAPTIPPIVPPAIAPIADLLFIR